MAASPNDSPALSRETQLAALARSPLLAALPPGGLEGLLDIADVIEVAPGGTVVREGESGGDMYFVLAGEARLRRKDFPLKALGAGGHFGALGLLTNQPRTVTVTAGARLTVARLTPARWVDLVAHHPRVAVSLLTALLVHVREDLVEMTDSVGLLLQGRSLPRAREVSVRVGGEVRRMATGTPLRHVLPAESHGQLVVAGLLNQKPVSLNTPLFADAAVAPLTIDESEGRQVWVRSLGLVLLEAAQQVAPGSDVRVGPSRGPVQLVLVSGPMDRGLLAERLTAAMQRIVEANAPFRQETWPVEEAQAYFEERGWTNAARLLATQRQANAPLVTCGELYAVAMGPFLPSTGALRGWKLEPLGDGLLLDYGRHDPRSNGLSASRIRRAQGEIARALASSFPEAGFFRAAQARLAPQARFVGEAIESALGQIGADVDVIVVNDGSTDDSPATIDALGSGDPRIRVISQPNMGLSAARNAGLDAARGTIVIFLTGSPPSWSIPMSAWPASWYAVRSRSSHGFCTTPQKPPFGKVIWKVNSDSGMDMTAWFTARVDGITWSRVEFAGVLTMPKMTPWSSVGASSFGDWENMSRASTPTATQAV